MSVYFIKRGYPGTLLEEAITLANSKDRLTLLQDRTKQDKDKDKVFLITTYHPHDSSLRRIVHNNWSFLGRSSTTTFLHEKKLMCGYRRPKNLRNHLMKAQVPYKKGDETVDPEHKTWKSHVEKTILIFDTLQNNTRTQQLLTKQKSITDFFKPKVDATPTHKKTTNQTEYYKLAQCNSDTTIRTTKSHTALTTDTHTNIQTKNRGFNFCNTKYCRYCPNINKTGLITGHYTKQKHRVMQKVSCRSSNLIYAITCKVCDKQYVGQTKLRLKDRFVHHYRSVELSNQDSSVGKHFSQRDHDGIGSMNITVLEFIKKHPQSDQAIKIRNRREKHWTHLLRSLAPIGLNLENPKEYKSSKKSK